MRWGGGGAPSIDDFDGGKSKVFPQPTAKDVIISDEDKVSWNDEIYKKVLRQFVVAPESEDYRGDELPDGYTQIEYLESSGTQWIDTGIYVSQDIKIECQMLALNDNRCCLYGVYEGGSFVTCWVGYGNESNQRFGSKYRVAPLYKNVKYIINHSAESFILNDIEYAYSQQTNFTSSKTLTIFQTNGYGAYAAGRCYNFKIYEGQNLKKDFIPCYSQNFTFGLYDVVTNEFYTNQGTGKFNSKCEVGDFISGTGTKADPYQISSGEDLAFLSYSSRNGTDYANRYFEFTDDIYLNDGYFEADGTYHDGGDGKLYEWTPMIQKGGNNFIGNNHRIYGFYVNNSSAETGLFTAQWGLNSIQDLTYSHVYVNCKKFLGLFAYSSTTISNCCVKDGNINASGEVCIIAGTSTYVSNCVNYADVNAARAFMGSRVSSYIKNCANYGNFNLSSSTSAGNGAICCYIAGSLVENCVNYGKLSCPSYGAGIFGSALNTSYVKIINCENKGTISGRNSGGIFAQVRGDTKFDVINCKNTGVVSGNSSGAIVGAIMPSSNAQLRITSCYVEKCAPVIGWFYLPNQTNSVDIVIKNSVFNCVGANSSTGDVFFGTTNAGYSKGVVNVEIQDVRVFLGNNTSLYLFRGSPYNVTLKNVLVDVNGPFDKTWNDGPIVDAKSLIIQQNGVPISYYGTNFNGYYYGWRDRKVGLKAIEDVGAFQGAVTEEWLESCGAEKRG